MSAKEHRLQLPLDAERYERVAREAARDLLRMTEAPDAGAGEGPAEFKEAYAEALDAKVAAT